MYHVYHTVKIFHFKGWKLLTKIMKKRISKWFQWLHMFHTVRFPSFFFNLMTLSSILPSIDNDFSQNAIKNNLIWTKGCGQYNFEHRKRKQSRATVEISCHSTGSQRLDFRQKCFKDSKYPRKQNFNVKSSWWH